MIAKASKGRGFRGVLSYVLSRDGAEIIATSMAARDARGLAREFGQVRRLRPAVARAVLHTAIALPPGETLSGEQWREVVSAYLDGMGLRDHQHVAVLHHDTEHAHLHLIASRIHPVTGTVASDSHDYQRQEVIMRQLEQRYGLRRVAPAREAPRRAPTRGEIERAVRTGEASIKTRLQQLCDAAARGATTLTQYVERLHSVGVDVILTLQQEDTRLTGIQYILDDVVMKGSDLGKGYAALGIQRRGVTYDKDRDAAAVRSARERAQHRALGALDRGPALAAAAHGRGSGSGGRSVGVGVGAAGGGGRERDRADDGARRGLDGAGGGADARPGGGDAPCSRAPAGGGSGVAAGADGARVGARDRGAWGRRFGGAADRVVALGRAGGAAADRTLIAVQRHLTALGCARYEVGLREQATGRFQERTWTAAQVIDGLAFLRAQNARGHDIYVRPAIDVAHALVLVDDLSREQVERMRADGYDPAALIETSPGNYQAWVKMAAEPLDADLRAAVARELARSYGGDPASTDARHFGRLAGFTNRKPQHARDGAHPYVLIQEWAGRVAMRAAELLSRLRQDLAQRAVAAAERLGIWRPARASQTAGDARDAYLARLAEIRERWPDTDWSRADWMIARDLVRAGYTVEAITDAIVQCSPSLEERKGAHYAAEYAVRTVFKATRSLKTNAPADHDGTAAAPP